MNLLSLNSHSRIQYKYQKQLITLQLITAIETTEMEACDAKKTNHPTNVYTNAYDQAMKLSGFDWDAGNWPKCGKHGVSREEIEEVFTGWPAMLADPHLTEPRQRAIGQTQAGRYVFVVFMFRETDQKTLLRPISARFMHQKEIDHYEKQKQAAANVALR